MVVLFVAIHAGAVVALGDLRTWLGLGLVLAYCACVAFSLVWARRGRRGAAIGLACSGLLLLVLPSTILTPDLAPVLVAPDLARIFEPYERAASGHTYGGFGLGLWIARQVVEAHGGAIAVQSAPGRGAAFTVTLPTAAPARTEAPP